MVVVVGGVAGEGNDHTSKTNSQHTPPLTPLPMLSAIIVFGESVDTSGLGWESRMTAERKIKRTHTEVTCEDLSHWSEELWALT